MAQSDDHEFMGAKKSKIQTYLILGVVLVIAIIIANFAIKNTDAAKDGVHKFLGLPGWAFPVVLGLFGVFVFWIGLKSEADWPEAGGAMIIAGAVMWAEIMVGVSHFKFGGVGLLPYVFPFATFLILLIYGQAKSK